MRPRSRPPWRRDCRPSRSRRSTRRSPGVRGGVDVVPGRLRRARGRRAVGGGESLGDLALVGSGRVGRRPRTARTRGRRHRRRGARTSRWRWRSRTSRRRTPPGPGGSTRCGDRSGRTRATSGPPRHRSGRSTARRAPSRPSRRPRRRRRRSLSAPRPRRLRHATRERSPACACPPSPPPAPAPGRSLPCTRLSVRSTSTGGAGWCGRGLARC